MLKDEWDNKHISYERVVNFNTMKTYELHNNCRSIIIILFVTKQKHYYFVEYKYIKFIFTRFSVDVVLLLLYKICKITNI